eukprot:246342_1
MDHIAIDSGSQGQLMMADMSDAGRSENSAQSAGRTIRAVEDEAIHLDFIWGKSCFKGKYPKWNQPRVTQLLHDRGLTDEKLEHELNLMQYQVNDYYGTCMKCYVLMYIVICLLGVACIGGQFGLTEYRENALGIFDGSYSIKIGIDFIDCST